MPLDLFFSFQTVIFFMDHISEFQGKKNYSRTYVRASVKRFYAWAVMHLVYSLKIKVFHRVLSLKIEFCCFDHAAF